MWTEKFIVGTCNCRTISFVTLISTIVISITMEIGWYTKGIGTSKLASVTWREILILKIIKIIWRENFNMTRETLTACSLIGIISTIIFMIAFKCCVNTTVSIGTSKLIESTSNAWTAILVFATSTIEISIAFLFWRNTWISLLSTRI